MVGYRKPRKPDFGRILTALTLNGEPDYVPLAELIISGEVMDAFQGRPVADARDVIDFQIAAGYDYVNAWPHYDWNPQHAVPREGRRVSTGQFSAYNADSVQIEWMPEGRGVITSMEEFEAHTFAPADSIDFSMFDAYNKHLPSSMKLIAAHGDIFRRVTELMGFETFCYALHDSPELVERVFERVGGIVRAIFERAVEQDNVGALWYCDDIAYTSGLLAPPDVLRKLAFPHYKYIAGLAHQKGVPIIYHSDGALWEVMDDLIDDIGFDALHPIEPKAMDIRELKRKLRDRACLIGNVDVDLLARGTPDEVSCLTTELIRDIAPGGGFILGSSNTVPNYCRVENYRAMVETGWRLGKHPISCAVDCGF